jgi:hypothetical protein
VVAVMKHPIFSCFACVATAVNPTVVYVKFITKPLAAIVAMVKQRIKQKKQQPNALGQQKKEFDAKTEQPILTRDAIIINN